MWRRIALVSLFAVFGGIQQAEAVVVWDWHFATGSLWGTFGPHEAIPIRFTIENLGDEVLEGEALTLFGGGDGVTELTFAGARPEARVYAPVFSRSTLFTDLRLGSLVNRAP